MQTDRGSPQTIDAYIAEFPHGIQAILQNIRRTIREVAPDAQEAIKYHMPTFILHGNLVHFAAFKQHIELYPTPSGITQFKEELAPYAGAKGSVRFPLDRPIPFDLIRKIVQFRVQENMERAAAKRKQRKQP